MGIGICIYIDRSGDQLITGGFATAGHFNCLKDDP